jgi:hypothetical protein
VSGMGECACVKSYERHRYFSRLFSSRPIFLYFFLDPDLFFPEEIEKQVTTIGNSWMVFLETNYRLIYDLKLIELVYGRT